MKRFVRMTMLVLGASALLAPTLRANEPKKPDFPPFDEVTKGNRVIEGFFTLYHDKEEDKLLLQIPSGMLDKPFFFATTLTQGSDAAGFQWMDSAVYFKRLQNKIALMAADPRYVKNESSPVADVIKRTYTDTLITSVDIATMNGGDPVIDLGGLFKTDLVQVGQMIGGNVDPELSRYTILKNFKDNTEIEVKLAVMGEQAGRFGGVHYSLSRLPENNGYTPREADNRIGYFITATRDWTVDHNARTTFKRYINRWHLRKSEEDKAVSDVRPSDQIVFWIEKTVPIQYRTAVREGILEWNKAFEVAGLRNAVAVVQQSNDDDNDPADVNKNFFRWIVTGSPFAMGPSRVNPYTGQILDADIVMDDSYIRYWNNEYGMLGPKPEATFGEDAPMMEFLAHHETWVSQRGFKPGGALSHHHAGHQHDAMEMIESIAPIAWGRIPVAEACRIAHGGRRELSMASFDFAINGQPKLSEEFIHQAIKETVMHEVGHTLGLRHNFKASSWLSLDEIRQIRSGEKAGPLSASVMDYNPYTYASDEASQGYFASQFLGPYDFWAIDYGYRHFAASEGEGAPKDEKEMLTKIAARCAEPGLAYATDEDTSFAYPDPSINRWDFGQNPLDFAKDRIDRSQRLWKDGLDWAIKDDGEYWRTRRVLDTLLGQYQAGAMFASRLVGGQYVNRDHKGDPNERPALQVVPAEQQRAALKFLSETALSNDPLGLPSSVYGVLLPGRWYDWGFEDFDGEESYDIHNRVAGIQQTVLMLMMSPFTVNRVYNAEMKVPANEDAFTLAELYSSVTAIVWSDLSKPGMAGNFTNRQPCINSHRRSLQRAHVQSLINLVTSQGTRGVTPDAQSLARRQLSQLEKQIGTVVDSRKGAIDDYTLAHLTSTKQRINKALDAQFKAPETALR